MVWNPLRRKFMQAGVTAFTLASGLPPLQEEPVHDDTEFHAVPALVGPASARPADDGPFFQNKRHYAFLYLATDTGEISHITHEDPSWVQQGTVLKPYEEENLPSSPPNGALYFDDDRGLPAWWDEDHYRWPTNVDDVLTTPATVANTTTRTKVWSATINPDSLITGRVYQIELRGTFQTANTNDQFTVDIDIAGTTLGDLQNAAANADPGTPWSLELMFTVRSEGATGTLKGDTRAVFGEQPRTSSDAETTVDTTVATTVEVFITWSGADADNSVTLEQAHLKTSG